MSKICKSCGEEIHPGRLKALPTATTCVECSTTGKKAGVTVMLGEGDHTYNEIVIMEEDQYKKYLELEQSHRKTLAGQTALHEFETGTTDSEFIEPEVDIPTDSEE